MTYRKRETMRDFARHLAEKYRIIERLRKQARESRREVEVKAAQ